MSAPAPAAAAAAAAPAAAAAAAAPPQAWQQAVGTCPLKRSDFPDTAKGKATYDAGCHLWTKVGLGCVCKVARCMTCKPWGATLKTHDPRLEIWAGVHVPTGYQGKPHPHCDVFGELLLPFVKGLRESKLTEVKFWEDMATTLLTRDTADQSFTFRQDPKHKKKVYSYDPAERVAANSPFTVRDDRLHRPFVQIRLLEIADANHDERIVDAREAWLRQNMEETIIAVPGDRRVASGTGAKSGSDFPTSKAALANIQRSWCACPRAGPTQQRRRGRGPVAEGEGAEAQGKKRGREEAGSENTGQSRKKKKKKKQKRGTNKDEPNELTSRRATAASASPAASPASSPAAATGSAAAGGSAAAAAAAATAATAGTPAGAQIEKMSLPDAIKKLPGPVRKTWEQLGMDKLVQLARSDGNKRLLFAYLADEKKNVAAQLLMICVRSIDRLMGVDGDASAANAAAASAAAEAAAAAAAVEGGGVDLTDWTAASMFLIKHACVNDKEHFETLAEDMQRVARKLVAVSDERERNLYAAKFAAELVKNEAESGREPSKEVLAFVRTVLCRWLTPATNKRASRTDNLGV